MVVIFSLSFVFIQDGFQDDSLRIMRDIERSSSHFQVCLYYHITISNHSNLIFPFLIVKNFVSGASVLCYIR